MNYSVLFSLKVPQELPFKHFALNKPWHRAGEGRRWGDSGGGQPQVGKGLLPGNMAPEATLRAHQRSSVVWAPNNQAPCRAGCQGKQSECPLFISLPVTPLSQSTVLSLFVFSLRMGYPHALEFRSVLFSLENLSFLCITKNAFLLTNSYNPI